MRALLVTILVLSACAIHGPTNAQTLSATPIEPRGQSHYQQHECRVSHGYAVCYGIRYRIIERRPDGLVLQRDRSPGYESAFRPSRPYEPPRYDPQHRAFGSDLCNGRPCRGPDRSPNFQERRFSSERVRECGRLSSEELMRRQRRNDCP